MATTFLEHLTFPNPELDISRRKEGSSKSKSRVSYGPYKLREWRGVTFDSLIMNYGEVLKEQTDTPSLPNLHPRRSKLYREESVTVLVEHWNEAVLDHVLRGTQEKLLLKQPGGPLSGGELYFTRNKGQGDVKDHYGEWQRPDWGIYQEQQDGEEPVTLVPGDTKVSWKWKSEWLKSKEEEEKKKGLGAIEQITKYMYLKRTRYGFIITDKELVPVRLTEVSRDMEAAKQQVERQYQKQVLYDDSMGDYESQEPESQGASSNVGHLLSVRSDGSYADSQRENDLVLEWFAIPWGKDGMNELTVNLILWWLSILAVHDQSFEKSWALAFASRDSKAARSKTLDREADTQISQGISNNSVKTNLKRRGRDGEGVERATRRPKRSGHVPNFDLESSSEIPMAASFDATMPTTALTGRRLRATRSRSSITNSNYKKSVIADSQSTTHSQSSLAEY